MFFRLRRAEIASAVPGCSTKNIITQRKFLRKFSEGRHMSAALNFFKNFYYFLKNRGKWGDCPLQSALRTASPKGKPRRTAVCLFEIF